MTLSLRQKLIFRVVLAVAFILVISGAALYLVISSDMHKQFDQRLLDRAHLLVAEVEIEPNGSLSDLQEFEPASSLGSAGSDILQLIDLEGVVHYRSPMMNELSLPVPTLEAGTFALTVCSQPDGRSLRCVHLGFHPEIETQGMMDNQNDYALDLETTLILTIGRDTGFLEHGLVRIRLILLAEVLVTLLVLVLALLALIRATLEPVETLAVRIGYIDPATPGEGLSCEGIPADFQPIVRRLNDLLSRLHDAFEREKKFSADFSHEMRTPLAGLRSTLEVGASRPRTQGEYQVILQDCLDMALGLQTLTETMLTLKRIENSSLTLGESTFRICELVGEVMDSFSARAQAKGMTMNLEMDPNLNLATDRSLLGLAVRNILDNALAHGEAGSVVDIRGGESKSGKYLEVSNSGFQFSQEDAQKLRARFRRGDPSRESGGGHAGLGLALVDSIGQALGFQVTVNIEPGGIYRIRFTFGNLSKQGSTKTP